MAYLILSCDGGGIRGALTAKLLEMLEKETPFLHKVDLFAGTSTGSLISLGLAAGFSPTQLVELYQGAGSAIFVPHSDDLGFAPKYESKPLYDLLKTHVFPRNPTLSDLKRKVVIPSFELCNPETGSWQPAYMDNFEPNETTVIDAALRSSAAPVFFPSYQGHVDGGVAANNPSMVALARVLDRAKQPLEDVRILSIGTGKNLNSIPENVSWGAAEWLVRSPLSNPPTPRHPLFNIITEGIVDVPHYQCQQILKENYCRFNPILPEPIALDECAKVDALIKVAESYVSDIQEDFRTFLKTL